MSRKVRLGRGELVGPDESRIRAYSALCLAIEAECPRVLEELALVTPDRSGLRAWSARFHLDAPWVRRFAEMTLDAWEKFPEDRGRRWFGFDRSDWAASDVPEVPFTATFTGYPGWCPSLERRKAARSRLLADLKTWAEHPAGIDAYLDSVEAAHRHEESVPPTARDRQHYRWAAMYLAGDNGPDAEPGWTYARVADSLQPTASGEAVEARAVQREVGPILAAVGLKARPPGRPRKS